MGRNENRNVAIIYRFLPQYRVDFFCRLREELGRDEIELQLIYGKNRDTPKQDERDLAWAIPVRNRTVEMFHHTLLWQELPACIREAELLILLQENKIVSNYLLLTAAPLRGQKVAFWGHGLNLQAPADALANRFKRIYSTWPDWWFAYTSKVARLVADMGFPQERITVVQNAIDTRTLARQAAAVSPEALARLRHELGIGNGPVGLFCGGMYKEKRIDFLLEACRLIRQAIPKFEVVFLGAGPDAVKIKEAVAEHRWMHYVGPKFDDERAPYFKLADVFLMPGLVGLAVLDCLATELPLVTTSYPFHSPEIEYLENGVNGLMAENSLGAFVSETVRVLNSKMLQERIRCGCREAAERYTLEAMVSRFAGGVRQALEAA